MNKRVIHFFGIFMLFFGACMSLPLLIALAYGEYRQAGAFLISMFICAVPGILVKFSYRNAVSDEKVNLRDSYLIVSVCWILASLFGCLPYLLSGVTDSFFLAFFETASGFSTTGATIFPRVEDLPHCILIWRALTQWLGGMGIIVLFFALLPKFGVKASTISRAETPGPIQRQITSRYSDTAQRLYYAYIILTAVLFVLLMIGGMNAFDALAHSFATMATGGFSTHSDGLAYFNSPFIYLVITIFAFLAGSNFTLFFDILAGKIKAAFKDEEYRRYVTIILVSSVLIASSLKLSGVFKSFTDSICTALFLTANTISTLGFESGDINMPPFCLLILVCLMIMGGCSSSTAGGVKVSRIMILFKVVKNEINQRIHDSMVNDVTYNGKKIQKDTMDYILSFAILYAVVVSVATIIISAFGGGDVLNNLVSVLSCIGNQGPAFDTFGLTCTYFTDSWVCVLAYTFVMIAGRLEITTFLVLFSLNFWNPYKA